MLSCRDVYELGRRQPLEELPWQRRLQVLFHMALCRMCRRYRRQTRLIDHLAGLRLSGPGTMLSLQARSRILRSLRESGPDSESGNGETN